ASRSACSALRLSLRSLLSRNSASSASTTGLIRAASMAMAAPFSRSGSVAWRGRAGCDRAATDRSVRPDRQRRQAAVAELLLGLGQFGGGAVGAHAHAVDGPAVGHAGFDPG